MYTCPKRGRRGGRRGRRGEQRERDGAGRDFERRRGWRREATVAARQQGRQAQARKGRSGNHGGHGRVTGDDERGE
eukprot:4792280-Prymnesium_polylepis.1